MRLRACVPSGGVPVATNKRGWHVPTVTLPRIRFGSGRQREDSPVATYYLVVISKEKRMMSSGREYAA